MTGLSVGLVLFGPSGEVEIERTLVAIAPLRRRQADMCVLYNFVERSKTMKQSCVYDSTSIRKERSGVPSDLNANVVFQAFSNVPAAGHCLFAFNVVQLL